MAKITNKQKEKETIGLALINKNSLSIFIENNLTAEDFTDKFNKKIISIILDEYRLNHLYFPSVLDLVDKIESSSEKEKKETHVILNRYKKMIEREVTEEEQVIPLIERNIAALKECTLKRRVINVLKNGLEDIGDNAIEWITSLKTNLNNIEINDNSIKELHIHTGFTEIKADMIEQAKNDVIIGYRTYYRDLDVLLEGQITDGSLTYVLGRPSNYKTGTALNVAMNQAENKIPVAIFSHEMDGKAVYRRLLSRVTKISMKKLKNPKSLTPEEWAALDEAIAYVKSLPLYVVDSAKLNITQIHSVVAYLQAKYGIKIIYEDYLQLIRTAKGNIPTEEGEFATISEELRNIAKDFNIAVIALCQANRSCEQRDDKRPTLKDIRSTGKAEMDAHNVLYVYRDEFYYGSKSELPSHLEIGALKVREGELKRVILHFNGALATLGDADPLITVDKGLDYIGGGDLFDV